MILFFLINGFLGVRLTPFINLGWQTRVMWLPLWLALGAIVLGRHLSRAPGDYRRVLLVCAGLFVLAPTLSVLREPPAVYLGLFVLAATAQMAASVTVTVTLARLAAPGPRLALILSSAYFLQGVMIPGFQPSVREAANPALALLGGTILAMGLYLLLRRLSPDVPAPAAEPAAADDPLASHQLSPREREVAVLLLRGASNREIAEECGITEHTVKTHVRRVLGKFNVPSRQAFVAACLGRGDLTIRNGGNIP